MSRSRQLRVPVRTPIKTHGFDRQSKVPKLEDTVPKVCRSCDKFFAARKREQRCDGCLTPAERRRRNLRVYYAQNGSPGRTGGFSRGGPVVPGSRFSGMKPQVDGTLSDGGQLCIELARELAEKIDYPKGAPKPMSRAYAYRVTERNVLAGKQDRRDLERYQSAS